VPNFELCLPLFMPSDTRLGYNFLLLISSLQVDIKSDKA
jgi:hypothetical protein